MNWNKIKAIVEIVRRRDALLTDDFGNPRPLDDVIVLLGVSDMLTADERRVLKNELTWLAETKAVVERLEANMP